MSELKRYIADVIYEPFHGGFNENNPDDYVRLTEHSEGGYIKYADHIAEVARLKADNDDLKGRVDWEEDSARSAALVTLEAENAALKAQLERASWKPITPESMPQLGDELIDTGEAPDVDRVNRGMEAWEAHHFLRVGYSHYRPINAPAAPPAKEKR